MWVVKSVNVSTKIENLRSYSDVIFNAVIHDAGILIRVPPK